MGKVLFILIALFLFLSFKVISILLIFINVGGYLLIDLYVRLFFSQCLGDLRMVK